MLAYVFWHRPHEKPARLDYEAAVAAFHEQLGRASCPGLEGSASFRISGAPWQDGAEGYEDWYLVEGSWALDPLNSAAVSRSPEEAHGSVAAYNETGAGGLYDLIWGEVVGPARRHTSWLGRPRGIQYLPILESMRNRLSEPVSCWRRRMVLGPAPEFALVAGPDLALETPYGWTGTAIDGDPIWPAKEAPHPASSR